MFSELCLLEFAARLAARGIEFRCVQAQIEYTADEDVHVTIYATNTDRSLRARLWSNDGGGATFSRTVGGEAFPNDAVFDEFFRAVDERIMHPSWRNLLRLPIPIKYVDPDDKE